MPVHNCIIILGNQSKHCVVIQKLPDPMKCCGEPMMIEQVRWTYYDITLNENFFIRKFKTKFLIVYPIIEQQQNHMPSLSPNTIEWNISIVNIGVFGWSDIFYKFVNFIFDRTVLHNDLSRSVVIQRRKDFEIFFYSITKNLF